MPVPLEMFTAITTNRSITGISMHVINSTRECAIADSSVGPYHQWLSVQCTSDKVIPNYRQWKSSNPDTFGV